MAIAVLGPVLLGFAVALAALLTAPDTRNGKGVLIWFTAGIGTGLVMFVPIAAAVKLRPRLHRWLLPHTFRIQWHVSLTMASAMGYVVASYAHKTFDGITALALLLVFLGAMTKTGLGIIFKRDDDTRWWV
jgi:hypothetical protein